MKNIRKKPQDSQDRMNFKEANLSVAFPLAAPLQMVKHIVTPASKHDSAGVTLSTCGGTGR